MSNNARHCHRVLKDLTGTSRCSVIAASTQNSQKWSLKRLRCFPIKPVSQLFLVVTGSEWNGSSWNGCRMVWRLRVLVWWQCEDAV
ncbi:hypothetical protein PENTCL1PPCAC_20073, partial [Pristionchus entomophagus]